MTPRKNQVSSLIVSSLVFLLTATAAVASGLLPGGATTEGKVVLPPGTAETEIQLDGSIVSSYGPFHGELVMSGENASYRPGVGFWQARSDFVILHTRAGLTQERVTRVTFVAGETGWNQAAAVWDGIESPRSGWQVDDPGRELEIVRGALASEAFLFEYGTEGRPPRINAILNPRDSGQGSTTSTTTIDVEVRDIPGNAFPNQGKGVSVFRIYDAGDPVVELLVEWRAISPHWVVRLASPYGVSDPVVLGEATLNRLVLQRWTNRLGVSGTDLRIHDALAAQVPSKAHGAKGDETHELLFVGLVDRPGGTQLVFESPTARRSATYYDPTSRLIYDPFTGAPDASWKVRRGFAQQVTSQDLPGPGGRFDVVLDKLETGQSSYLERNLPFFEPGISDPQLPGPDGHALRFWLDPSELSLAGGARLNLFAACPSSGPCRALRLRLERDGLAGMLLVATAMRDDGTNLRIDTPVTSAPQQVEVRMRNAWTPEVHNGWIELWVDGELRARTEGIANALTIPAQLRLGVLSLPAGASGIVGLDEFEAWRFE